MTSRLTEVIIDAHDIERLATFWCAVLGYQRLGSGEGWLAIGGTSFDDRPSDDEIRARPIAPAMAFVVVPESKAVKNRVHIDVTPIDRDRDAEVDRLLALGASHADIGQVNVPWVVMRDPEGNEFCVMPGIDDDTSG